MNKKISVYLGLILASTVAAAFLFHGKMVHASEFVNEGAEIVEAIPTEKQDITSKYRYDYDMVMNVGMKNDYSGKNRIQLNDPHYGWKLGYFYLNGFTEYLENAKPTFLKSAGDAVVLGFELNQDINCLNNNSKLSIAYDKHGCDEAFEVRNTDFGRGTLIIQYTDYRNHSEKPVIYKDYLTRDVVKGAKSEIKLCEEGDYEVALNYKIKYKKFLFPKYMNYRISFQFSVRNSASHAFLVELNTKKELENGAITSNGFMLDLANSKYLDVDVKHEVLSENRNCVVEKDVPDSAKKDGYTFSEDGIYHVTVNNPYSGQETTKKVYVGTDEIMKAYFATGISIKEIKDMIADGATIDVNGAIIPAQKEEPQHNFDYFDSDDEKLEDNESEDQGSLWSDIQDFWGSFWHS